MNGKLTNIKLFKQKKENLYKTIENFFSKLIFHTPGVSMQRYLSITYLIVAWNVLEAIPVLLNYGSVNILNAFLRELIEKYYPLACWAKKVRLQFLIAVVTIYPTLIGLLEEFYRHVCSSKTRVGYVIRLSFYCYCVLIVAEYFLIFYLIHKFCDVELMKQAFLNLRSVKSFFNMNVYAFQITTGRQFTDLMYVLYIINRLNATLLAMLCVPLNKISDLHISSLSEDLSTKDKSLSKVFIKGSLSSISRIVGRMVLFVYLFFAVYLKIYNPLFLMFITDELNPIKIYLNLIVFTGLNYFLYSLILNSFEAGNQIHNTKEDDYKLNKQSLINTFYIVFKTQLLSPYYLVRGLFISKDKKDVNKFFYALVTFMLYYHSVFKYVTDHVTMNKMVKKTIDFKADSLMMPQVFNATIYHKNISGLIGNAISVLLSSTLLTLIGVLANSFNVNTNILDIIYAFTYGLIIAVIPFMNYYDFSSNTMGTLWMAANLSLRLSYVKFYYKKSLDNQLSEMSNLGNLTITVYISAMLYAFQIFTSLQNELYIAVGLLGFFLNLVLIYFNTNKKSKLYKKDVHVVDDLTSEN